jgi:hypothetical protein
LYHLLQSKEKNGAAVGCTTFLVLKIFKIN